MLAKGTAGGASLIGEAGGESQDPPIGSAPTELAIPALLTHRAERSTPLDWIQIGSMAGQDIALPSFALRAANLRIMGSGQGSLTAAGIIAEPPSLIGQLTAGTLTVAALPLPLAQVEGAWTAPTEPGRRIVLTTSAQGR